MVAEIEIEGAEKLFIFEKHRLESFKSWPFADDQACSIKNMAEAGFYWCGNERETDTAACFVCDKILDGWEATDDPWKEHAKHAPQCMFVKYRKPEKDFTVEEFLDLFGNVIKGHLNKIGMSLKKRIRQTYEKHMNKFLSSCT
ncbi:baculoviral IAP repeat-containing protein 5 [Episyrphus balteatus]|uniref:baculoviral IAP repeat-containing protein 5 n=1 Tax=Episyrphus balteatus TaxID=286459 RepID=UPI0024865491|nr:baculoviral IAP repeat-containing protein 5 [Episyrphus balteatus]